MEQKAHIELLTTIQIGRHLAAEPAEKAGNTRFNPDRLDRDWGTEREHRPRLSNPLDGAEST
jgi:hypothetical protein